MSVRSRPFLKADPLSSPVRGMQRRTTQRAQERQQQDPDLHDTCLLAISGQGPIHEKHPYQDHDPTRAAPKPGQAAGGLLVLDQFFRPEVAPCSWSDIVLGTTVPEATVDKYRHFFVSKCQVTISFGKVCSCEDVPGTFSITVINPN